MSRRATGCVLVLAGGLFLFAGPAPGADPWGLEGEEVAKFEAKVVDLACELGGECPASCGEGRRQLGLIDQEGALWPVVKGQVIFANAVDDLIPYCGQTVFVDGLKISNPKMHLFMLQYLSADGESWSPADRFGELWSARNGEDSGSWYWNDPLIKETIAENGVRGLGPDHPDEK